jgi:50S ribosomal subunit-associated GTPase HflX
MNKLGIEEKRTVIVFNKSDIIPSDELVERLLRKYPGSVAISAKQGDGIKTLLNAIKKIMDEDTEVVDLHFSSGDGKLISWVRDRAYVLQEKDDNGKLFLKVRMRNKDIEKLKKQKSKREN